MHGLSAAPVSDQVNPWTWLQINDLAALQVSGKMAEPDADMDALMTRMDTLQTQIEAADGWELERQLERAMDALRCPSGDISFSRGFMHVVNGEISCSSKAPCHSAWQFPHMPGSSMIEQYDELVRPRCNL